MKISEILDKRGIKINLEAATKEETLKELVGILAQVENIGDQKSIVKALLERENLGSTGIGQGIAIPHGKTDKVNRLVAVLGTSKKGINFDALDNQPVNLVMLFLVPQGQFQKHLHTLANIAKLLHKAEFRQALEQAPDADAMLKIIREHGKK